MPSTPRKPIVVTFTKVKEGSDKVHYKETAPGGVIGTLYLSNLAIHYQWGGEAPGVIDVSITPGDAGTVIRRVA